MTVASRSRRPVAPRILAAAVVCAAYLIALFRAPVTPWRTVGALGGSCAGLVLALEVWSLAVLALGPWCGLAARIISFGVGPALRTSFGEKRIVIVRRVPLPVLTVDPGVGPGKITRWRLVVGALAALAVQMLLSGALLFVDPPCGTAAGIACLGAALIRLGQLLHYSTPRSAGRLARLSVGDIAARQVLAVAQRSLSDARRLIEGWSDPELSASISGRTAELMVLAGEGRYREAISLSELLVQEPDLSAVERMSIELTRARVLGYVMELEQPEPADRERFLSLYCELYDAPAQLISGSDLQALYHLVKGDVGPAVDEARSASRVGSAPLRRCMTYCTLALALHRAGRTVDAHKALTSARSTGCDAARIDFVARVLDGDVNVGNDTMRRGRVTAVKHI